MEERSTFKLARQELDRRKLVRELNQEARLWEVIENSGTAGLPS